jgi:alkanesulfonate monooxygenase SsuD/methylene tetrahydromethanopterin reductase-like flavin-dependent oxidoreductase (luciferase family)
MGKKPGSLESLEHAVQVIRDLNSGKKINYDGQTLDMSWANAGTPPIWIAGYGPKALRCAGRIGDGVVLQFADPALIKWCLGFVEQGAREAGRDFSKIRVMSATAVWASDDKKAARERVRWFPALVSNHVVDLVSRYKPEELPAELTSYVRDRKGYNYLHHAEVGSSNAEFVSDDVVDRFCIVGTAADHIGRLKELQSAGVTQFNIYLMCGEEEKTLEIYGRDIIPKFGN